MCCNTKKNVEDALHLYLLVNFEFLVLDYHIDHRCVVEKTFKFSVWSIFKGRRIEIAQNMKKPS